MTKENEKTLEELEAEYKAELTKKVQAMQASNEAREKAEKVEQEKIEKDNLEAAKIEQKEQLLVEVSKEFGIDRVAEKPIDKDAGETTRDAPKGEWAAFHEKYLKQNKIEYHKYDQVAMVTDNMGFAFDSSDSSCDDDISDWSPADVYCDLIWQAAQCGKQLSGIITQRACDISQGNGLSVQIKTISARTMGSSLAACECSSCVSNVFGTYTLTLARYDVNSVVCELDIFDVGDSLKAGIVESMSRAFISGIDSLIWTAVSGATPGYTETSGTSFTCDPSRLTNGACCTYGADLYTEIIELEARMRAAGYGSKGFFAIMHPRVALYLKYREGISPPAWVNNITMEGNKLSKIGDIKVIEYCGANSCADAATGGVAAVLVDPERAVGEAYGKRPHFLSDKDPIECDSTKLIMRTYIAVSALDTGAIGHVTNP